MRERVSHVVGRLRGWVRARGANEVVALVVAGAVCVSTWAFLELADEMLEGEHQEVEIALLRLFRDPADPSALRGPPWVDEITRDITALGSTAVLTIITALVLAYLVLSQRIRHALLVLSAIVGGALLSSLLKLFFGRERPGTVPHLTTTFDSSFPSGHAMVSSVVYLTLGALLAQAVTRRREHLFFINAALLLTFLVGVSRMALGVHYPSDVLAGWAAGVAWALFCWTVAWWLGTRRRFPDRHKASSSHEGS